MPISALVVTLESLPEAATHTLQALRAMPQLTLGEAHGTRLPVVAETPSLSAGRELVEAMAGTAGVLQVDVLSVQFEDA